MQMSGFGISINPAEIASYSQNKKMFNASREDQLRQAAIDNQFRTEQWNYYKGQQNQIFNERHSRLQNLRRDAEKAGIGINAALGVGGSSPISINMPSGQGGRVSGNYSRNSAIGDIAQFQMEMAAAGSALDNKIKNEQSLKLQTENAILRKQLHDMHNPQPLDDRYGMYVPAYDNREGLINKYGNDITLFPNPDINLETPESLGLYYYGKGQIDPTPITTPTDNWDDFSIYRGY